MNRPAMAAGKSGTLPRIGRHLCPPVGTAGGRRAPLRGYGIPEPRPDWRREDRPGCFGTTNEDGRREKNR
ncbi:hypothetical protein FRAHR75_80124 [Frankia sp. Hr75.2]|nr:hypothetical protein FRAHR75_80124 [Frankia sp. Hr75.2]SQD96651.1 hypothetical protein FMEAI12_3690007 [Parafrankia sp. Ea1.12]